VALQVLTPTTKTLPSKARNVEVSCAQVIRNTRSTVTLLKLYKGLLTALTDACLQALHR
jgi:hypothetical protein